MDVQMPELDGLEATKQIRNPQSDVQNHRIPIIAMTASAMQDDRDRCLNAGMNDYLSKPVSMSALAEAVERWLPKEETTGNRSLEAGQQPRPASGLKTPIPICDRAGLMARLMGDQDLARVAIDAFLDDLPKQIEALRGFLETGDVPAAARQAHTIKGASANIGGEALRAVALEMEMAGTAGDLAAARVHLADLEAQFDQLKKAIVHDP